jgi:Family of unknown function (DUF5996)
MHPDSIEPMAAGIWPPAPQLEDWRDTQVTLQMLTQIVGKTRLALAPMLNHWWQVALHVNPRGLTTLAMPSGSDTLSLEFDFVDHSLHIVTGHSGSRTIPLGPRSVADFHAAYRDTLRSLGHAVKIWPVPVEIEVAIPFPDDREHASYDPNAVAAWWNCMTRAHHVMERFRGDFLGKSSPVHFFWGAFDLAHTRFSGRTAPRHPGGIPNCPDRVMVEAYSHECSSCGFWPGGGAIAEPAFYAYAWPEPDGYADRIVRPEAAFYSPDLREFILPYEFVRRAREPDQALLAFFESTYRAAADAGAWDRALLERRWET